MLLGKSMNNRSAFVLVLVLASSSLMVVELAQSATATPSVPEFTMKFSDRSYDVPASTSIDPYTGKTAANPAYHVENKTVEFTIKNQPINPAHFLDYRIRVKGHFSENWTICAHVRADANSESTVISFSSTGKGMFYASGGNGEFYAPSEGQVDFQVQAYVWHYVPVDQTTNPFGGWTEAAVGESDWSSTQTLKIPADASVTSPDGGTTSGGGTQLIEASSFILGVAITAIVAACVGWLLLCRKRRQEAGQA
jgi:hypothetical protein